MKTTECPNKSLSLDEAIAHADEVAGDCGTACKREHKQLADWLRELKSRRSAKCGDVAKLCEALVEARKVIKSMGGYWARETLPIIDAALAAPARNCDVGTLDEQRARLKAFCDSHGHGFDGQKNYSCENCPFIDDKECELAWANQPISKEGGVK